MIVDTHYHFMRLPADESRAREMASEWLFENERSGVKRSLDEVMPIYRDYTEDLDCDKLVKRMDQNGLDASVVCIVDNKDLGQDSDRLLRFNERCAKAAARHPGRIIALAGIDPRRPEAPTLLRKCLVEYRMKGLKWHTDHGYYPDSPEAYAVLEVANELGGTLLTHCGPLPHTRAKYSHPLHLDDIALDFPKVNFIAAHMGDVWWHDWAALAKYKTNIYGDLAMWQLMAVSQPHLFRRYLREILDIVGPTQVLFASDGPVCEPHVSNRRWVEIMKDLTKQNADGLKFCDEEINAILGGNASRIFKLRG